MKLLRLLLPALIVASLSAQTANIQKTISTNSVTADFRVGSGRTVYFDSGSTLTISPSASVSGIFTNPMTALGDIIIGASGGTAIRLAAGTDGYVLTMSGGVPVWNNSAGAPSSASFILQTANGSLPSAQALGDLATGLLKSTTTSGILSSITTSAGIAGVISDETGSGALVFGTSPTLGSPTLTTPTISGAVTFPSNVRQTFVPGATNAGFNAGSYAGVPSSLSNGDLWYDSTAAAMKFRANGTTVALPTSTPISGSLGSVDKTYIRTSGTSGSVAEGSTITDDGGNGLLITQQIGSSTQSYGVQLFNAQTATSIAPDAWSASVIFHGTGWKSNATAAAQNRYFTITERVSGGAAAATSKLAFGSGSSTAAVTDRFTIGADEASKFYPNSSFSGLNVGSYAGVPSTLANGDLWYDSTANQLKAYINGSATSLGAGGGTPGGSTTQIQYNSAGSFGGIAELTYASNIVTDTRLLAANTPGTGMEFTNTSTASSGNQMYSPGIVFTGQGWKTNSTAASQAVNFRQELRPAQGTANPVGNLYFSSQINGGGYTSNERFLISSDGYIGAINGSGLAAEIRFYEAATQRSAVGYSPANSRAYWYNNGTSAEAIQVKNAGEVALIGTGTNQNISLTPSGTGRVQNSGNYRTNGGQMEFYNTAGSTELLTIGGGSTYGYFYNGNGANIDAVRFYYSSPFMAIYPTAVHNIVIGAATDASTGVIQLPSATSATAGIAMGDVNIYRSASNVLKTDDALTVTGVITATGGVLGTATNNNATAGNVGEYVSSLIAVGSAASMTTATALNITSISLTAGDWDVEGNVNFTEGTATVSARSAGITSTSATVPTDGSEAYCGVQSTVTSETNTITLPRKRFSLSGTTTVYLVGSATFSAGTCSGFGSITARRVR